MRMRGSLRASGKAAMDYLPTSGVLLWAEPNDHLQVFASCRYREAMICVLQVAMPPTHSSPNSAEFFETFLWTRLGAVVQEGARVSSNPCGSVRASDRNNDQ